MKRDRLIYILVGFCIAFIISLAVSVTLVATGVFKPSSSSDDYDLIITTDSATKVYDGSPLTDADFRYEGELKEGHVLNGRTTGSQTEIGRSPNYIILSITDRYGNDVTGEYVIKYVYGTLTVISEEEASYKPGDWGEHGGDGSIDSGARIADDQSDISNETGGESGGEANDMDFLRLYSDRSGMVYLRYKSFGDYNGRGFNEATLYTALNGTRGVFNPTVNLIGSDSFSLSVNVLTKSGQYFLPYYATTEYELNGDVTIDLKDSEYTVEFKPFDYLTGNNLYSFESLDDYNYFVHKNYLTIDNGLKYWLLDETGFSVYDYNLVPKIVDYVKNAATYNASAEAYPQNVDIVRYFIEERGEGKCTDFAAAATMIFRAYGIPARYTTGFAANLVANEFVTVTSKDAHAWVEIYLDNVGWVYLEVTGGSFSPSDYGEVRDLIDDPNETENVPGAISDDQSKIADEDGKFGEIGGDNGSDEGEGSGGGTESSIVMTVTSDYNGSVYLRYKSFNYYTGRGFVNYLSYDKDEVGVFNPTVNLLQGRAYTADINLLAQGEQFYLPYYSPNSFNLKNDVSLPYGGDEYTVSFIPFQYLSDAAIYGGNDLGDYNEFVRSHYLSVDSSLKNELLRVSGYLSGGGKVLVAKILSFLQNRATYNAETAEYPDGEDMVRYFINVKKEGKCSDFAAAATMLLRAYGIPARYTIGFLVQTVYGKTIEVTAENAHAWVEIYLDDIGWVYVDATPAETIEKTVKITSEDRAEIYTGEPYFVEDDAQIVLGTDDTFKIVAYPSVTEIGDKIYNCPEIRIYDKYGIDVTDTYTFDFSDCGYLEVLKRPLIVETDSASKEYDGEPLYGTYVLIEGSSNLLDGHTIYASSITEPGVSQNEIKVIDEFGNDVSSYYDIVYQVKGWLTVNKIALYYSSEDDEKPYDGTPLVGDYEFTQAEKVLDRHELSIESAQITEVGTVGNDPTFIIIDKATGIDVTDAYYSIYCVNGSHLLTVKKRTLIITGVSHAKPYDGTPLTAENSDYTFAGDGVLTTLHELTINALPSINTVTSTPNVPDISILNKFTFEDVTEKYYEINTDGCGVLQIFNAMITVKSSSHEKAYDGTPLTADSDVNISYDGSTVALNGSNVVIDAGGLLAAGYYIDTASIEYPSITEPGTINNCPSFRILDYFGNEVGSDTYYIDYSECGSLKITARPLKVVTYTDSHLYTGDEYFGEYGVIEGSVLASHSVIGISLIKPGSKSNEIKLIDSDGNDVNNYYDIEYVEKGTLTVNRRTISVESGTYKVPYTGEAYTVAESDYVFSGDGVLASHTMTFTPASISAIGVKGNVPAVKITDNLTGKDVTDEYYLINAYYCGQLEMYGATVRVKSNERSKIYDGTPLSLQVSDVIVDYSGTLTPDGDKVVIDVSELAGFTVSIVSCPVVSTPKKVLNCPEFKIVDANGNEVDSASYSINYDGCSTLVLEARPIVITTGASEKEYDGTPLTNDNMTVTNLLDGDKVVYEITGSQTLPGVSTNSIKVIRIEDKDGNDVTVNYAINVSAGTLKVYR